MTTDQKTTALVVNATEIGLPTAPQSDPSKVTDALVFAAQHANVLAPVSQITFIPPGYQIEFMVVRFPTDGIKTYEKNGATLASRNGGNGLWYAVSGGALALHKRPLMTLARASGVSWRPTIRNDDGSHPYYWDYTAMGLFMGMDGVERPWPGSATYDLRHNPKNGEMSAAALKAAGDAGLKGVPLREARIHGGRRCETMAQLACIRAALAVGAYTWEEAQRPFVLPILRGVLDLTNPVVAKMHAAKVLGIVAEMYGPDAGASDAEVITPLETKPAPPAMEPASRQLPAPSVIDDIPQAAKEKVPVERQGEPWEQGDQQQPQREQFKPTCGAPDCGLPLSNVQANKTADTDDGLRCQDHEAQQ